MTAGVARTFRGRAARKEQSFRAIALDLKGEKSAKIFMSLPRPTQPAIRTPNFAECFFAPARTHLGQAPSARVCAELSDDQWPLLGVRGALEERPSGRAFLQHLSAASLEPPTTSNFFATLKSDRRLALIAEVSRGLARNLPALGADFWGGGPELAGFEIHAGDGHFHAGAAHELRQGAGKGRMVLYVWDRAGIDFQEWHDWKHSGGRSFLSREPSGAR